jgi:hypothetical protein
MSQNIIAETVNKLFNTSTNNYIFIYTPPKVGSTTLVTSLRVSLGKSYNVIHIHDEIMLSVLTGINNVKMNDIIHFLSNQEKNVYVIDVYRTPIERKMSEYFEKVSPYHFNNSADNISNYSIKRITDRFNKIFPHIQNGEHYFEKYDIPEPVHFDFKKKHSLQNINSVKYIKLRLCDSSSWSNVLSSIFKSDIVIIHDYKTEDKSIGKLYNQFKNKYRLPSNYLDIIKNDKYLNFYYNESEKNEYLNMWENRLTAEFTPYNEAEYAFYINLCLENQYINDIEFDHYIDNGCLCVYCTQKRQDIFIRAKAGEKNFEKIIHREVINEVKNEKINKINGKLKALNEFIIKRNKSRKFAPNQFSINISNK